MPDWRVRQHRVRTVWSDAVPPVAGLDGYPECVQALLDPEPPKAVELTVPIPHEYWRAHALEIASPSQSRPADELQAAGWEALETVWLHGTGREIAWVNVLRAPSADIFLEFWTKDRQTGETAFLSARPDASTVAAFETFLKATRPAFSEEAVPQSDDHEEWMSVASSGLCGHAGVRELAVDCEAAAGATQGDRRAARPVGEHGDAGDELSARRSVAAGADALGARCRVRRGCLLDTVTQLFVIVGSNRTGEHLFGFDDIHVSCVLDTAGAGQELPIVVCSN